MKKIADAMRRLTKAIMRDIMEDADAVAVTTDTTEALASL
jgi:hypothetical protein